MAKKMTKVEKFEKMRAVLEECGVSEFNEFIDHEIELISKKNGSRKMTATQVANEGIKTQILEFLADGKSCTVGEIQKAVGLESNQKTSALVRQLKESGAVVRSEVKGKAYFALA